MPQTLTPTISTAEQRQWLDFATSAELLSRARKAVSAELGATHSPEQRAECLAAIIGAGLEAIGPREAPPTDGPRAAARRAVSWKLDDAGNLTGWRPQRQSQATAPRRRDILDEDRAHSYTAYCGRAKNWVRDQASKDAREDSAQLPGAGTDDSFDDQLQAVVDSTPMVGSGSSLVGTIAHAVALLDALDIDGLNAEALAWEHAAGEPSDLGCTPDTYRQRLARGAAQVRDLYGEGLTGAARVLLELQAVAHRRPRGADAVGVARMRVTRVGGGGHRCRVVPIPCKLDAGLHAALVEKMDEDERLSTVLRYAHDDNGSSYGPGVRSRFAATRTHALKQEWRSAQETDATTTAATPRDAEHAARIAEARSEIGRAVLAERTSRFGSKVRN